MHYLIIGASAAGTQAAEELRRLDGSATISVVTRERLAPYSRCLISRFADGRLKESNLLYKGADFFKSRRVEAVTGTTAIKIDRTGHKVLCDNGTSLSYDKLLLATGARPNPPRVPGAELPTIFGFHTIDDAVAIATAAATARTAVVVGAGFTGLEAAYALAKRGCSVTVVERCSQVLPNQFDIEGGAIIQRDLESSGVRLVFNQSVASIEDAERGRVTSVLLANKDRLTCDMVVFATGVTPETALAADAGLVVQRGIVVNEYLQTSDPDIYAAGDAAEILDSSSGTRSISATWFNAVLQGRYAALNMAGKPRPYTGQIGIQNAVQFHRVPAISFGQTLVDPDNQDDFEVMSVRKDNYYRKLVMRNNKLVGLIFVGDIVKSGFYAALIRYGVDIAAHKRRLLDDDFSYAAFARREQFGQYDPYADTDPSWEAGGWWARRAQCITG